MVMEKRTYTIKPSTDTPNEVMYLSVCDRTSAITHAPTIYTYPNPSQELSPPRNPIDILKDSMSKALSIFYPLAGRLVGNNTGRLELHCNSAGARLTEVVSQKELSDYGDFCPSTQLTLDLVPQVDRSVPLHEIPVLLVQLTRFKCGGMCLGLGISHVVADGQACLFFVSEWARIARGEQPSSPKNLPVLDRTILQLKEAPSNKKFDFQEYKPSPLLIGHVDDLEQRLKESCVAMLKLTDVQIDKLRDKANQQVVGGLRPFTRYEAVTSHIWRCVTQARRHVVDQPTRLRTVVNFRNRMDPPLSPFYFGNALVRPVTVSTSGDLTTEPLGYTASNVRSTVEKITDEYVRASLFYLDGFKDLSQFQNFHTVGYTDCGFFGNPNVEITSWIGLPLQNPGFGWGKNEFMGPGGIGFDGKCFLISSHDGFTIPIRLQKEHMDDFKKFFYDEI